LLAGCLEWNARHPHSVLRSNAVHCRYLSCDVVCHRGSHSGFTGGTQSAFQRNLVPMAEICCRRERKKGRYVGDDEAKSPIHERRDVAIVAGAESRHQRLASAFGGSFVSCTTDSTAQVLRIILHLATFSDQYQYLYGTHLPAFKHITRVHTVK